MPGLVFSFCFVESSIIKDLLLCQVEVELAHLLRGQLINVVEFNVVGSESLNQSLLPFREHDLTDQRTELVEVRQLHSTFSQIHHFN